MAEVQLNLDSSILEEIIDKSRDRFDMADTPTRVRNLLDYFDATEPRTILGPLRNHSMLIELVGFLLFPYSQGHHSERLESYFIYYLTHPNTRCTLHKHDIEEVISGSSLRNEWKQALLRAIGVKNG